MKKCSEIRLYVMRFSEDSPSASTGVKLYRLGVAERIGERRLYNLKGIILDPYAETLISKKDLSEAKTLVVIDRSWNVLEKEKRMRLKAGKMLRRRLPLLIASNPINYTKAFKLSSAEALAAALAILGCQDRAKEVMSKFKWGDNFFSLNAKLFELYNKANDAQELLNAEKEAVRLLTGGESIDESRGSSW